FADFSETRIDQRIVTVRRLAVEDAAGTELLAECGIFGVIRQFGFLFRVEVIEVAVELVESMSRRYELVPIAEMVLAKLARRVTERLQHRGDRRIVLLKAERRTGQANLRHAGTQARLTSDKGGTARGAA